jgi:hypothetical protein
MAAEYFGCDVGVAVVRDEHQHFYRRVFGYQLRTEPRSYPLLTKPFRLMTVDFPSERENMCRRYPFFRSTAFERRMLFDRKPSRVAAQSAA